MARVAIGSLCVFNHEVQEWPLYKGRLEQWFLANEINSDADKCGAKRRAILLSSLAENTYRLIRDLALPKDVGTLQYETVIRLFDGHFKSKKCGFAERHNFHTAVQESGESFAQWAARVRGLAMDCGFSAETLKDTLRDRFVLGMVGGPERDRVFGEDIEAITFERAVELAESVRCARDGARRSAAPAAMPPPAPPLEVHRVTSQARGHPPNSPSSSAPPAPRDRAPTERCSVCGFSGHGIRTCKFKNYECRKCGVRGHLKRVCDKKGVTSNFLQCEADDGDDGERFIFNIRSVNGEPMRESVVVSDVRLTFELDTGSAVTAISDEIYKKYFSSHRLRENTKILQSYNGGLIKTLGIITLPFIYARKTKNLDVFVVKGGGPPLLGRDFIHKFKLQICQINSCDMSLDIDKVIGQYPQLFSDKLGCCKGVEVKIKLKPDSTPIYFKARSVPFALRNKLEQELNRLVSIGIIEPVTFTEYASPVVPVIKNDGSIRLCADYSVTLNKHIVIDKYPLPRIDELFAKLHGGVLFTKLDLSSAYNQIMLDNQSKMLTTINTHKGLYRYNRLVFGLSSAPAIFQRTLEKILAGVDGVLQFLDDILVTGRTEEEHLARLYEVFRRLEGAGLVLRKDKCSFFQNSVSYLGFIIDKNGLHKSPEKVKAVMEAKRPENVTELKSFLGLVNYYRSFVPNASSILCPLHELLEKKTKWCWGSEQNLAFESIKNLLSSDNTLAHFNPDAKLVLTVDASPYGLGAILSQVEGEGVEKPISYASRSLNSAEKQYSQIQKEATAIIFGVRKYHQYLYGRAEPFILKTDHKPLLSIFSPGKGIPEVTANRLQRYALFLAAYNYTIEYVSSVHNSADYLSRSMAHGSISINSTSSKHDVTKERSAVRTDFATYVNFVWQADKPPVSVDDVRRATVLDRVLSQVLNYSLNGWPSKINDKINMKPYFDCRFELAVENGCLMRGSRLVVPEQLRANIIEELHRGHLGITKMKAEARSRFWWAGMSISLERAAAACAVCAQLRPAPRRAPLTPWPYPPEPWYRVHLDFLGPFNSKVYLVAVDAYSKWVEVYDVSGGYGSRVVIEKLCELMSRFGLIHTICTDNGTSFVSHEFENFCSTNGITHLTSPTYHPASNGQAESYVKIVKNGIKAILVSGALKKDINVKLNEFLFNYRNSIHSTTNRSPAQVLFGKNLRCRLDLIKPTSPPPSDTTLATSVKDKQFSQAKCYRGNRNIDFNIGDLVLVKAHYQQNTLWTKGVIEKKIGKSAYLIKLLESDRLIKRHKNQIYELKGEREVSSSSMSAEDTLIGRPADSATVVTPLEDLEFLPPVILMQQEPQIHTHSVLNDNDSVEGSKETGQPSELVTQPVEEEAGRSSSVVTGVALPGEVTLPATGQLTAAPTEDVTVSPVPEPHRRPRRRVDVKKYLV